MFVMTSNQKAICWKCQ